MAVKNKVNVLPEIEWFYKTHKRGAISSKNVGVSINSAGKDSPKGTKRLSIVFRDKLFKQFDSRYIAFGIFKNRIYFKPVKARDGYAITDKGLCGYCQATIKGETIAKYESFIGDWTLRFDEYYELYYIDIEQEDVI